MTTQCSLIISTYNRPDALRLCLESAFSQYVLPKEIIVADDGSGYPTGDLIRSLQKSSPVKITHVWHADEGYRLASIRNKAFVQSNTEYIIQIDGDLILDNYFVHDHLQLSKPGTFISGTRTMMDHDLTAKLLGGEIRASQIRDHASHLDKIYNARRNMLLRRISYWFLTSRRNYKYVLGCNMAFWKRDLEKVNGYNEMFTGWGKEDNELAVRLQNAGIRLRFIKYGAVAFHLHHQVANLNFSERNEQMLAETIQNKTTFVNHGMNRHAHSGDAIPELKR